MKQDKARELIKDTFENPFDKERYTWFLKNLFPDKIEFRNKVYTGNYIKEAFRNYIRKYEQIGKFEDAEGNTIDLLAVELLRGQSIERARTSQRNFIAQYLKNKNHREGALVAFYSEGSDDWRFSLIKMEYSLEKKKDELTPAKRFSFLVGKDEKSHTAQKQLTALLTMQSVPLMQEIEASFNIETVTKEFFEKYKQLFLDLHEHIEKQIAKSKPLRDELESKNIDAASFTKKLLGQIVFLYFLQKKGWLGVPKNENWGKGDKRFLRSLLDNATEQKENFFTDYLVYLFYEALAKENRGGSDSSYYKRLDCRIPFLNGGLFEADYDWENITVDIPNKFFTNRNITKEGDSGDGILDVFDRYNFTVKEDEPLDKEVAVDPEMLGKVFENLLTVKDRKSKGAFYTPREIVHYMCQESLIAYLDTELNGQPTSFVKMGDEQTQLFGNDGKQGQLHLMAAVDAEIIVPKKDIETFIREGIAAIENDARVESKGEETSSYSYQLPESIRNHAKEIDKALADIRICDPAIGSGAFPVGMMNEIVKAREILSVYLRDAKQKDRTAYELKRHAIQECIYGVDIDHSAIDIAKLRLWLSLVVDEEDFHKIKPLPNLDYKIVEGNSLDNIVVKDLFASATFTEIEKLKEKFFVETNHTEKVKLRKQISKLISEMTGNENHFDYEIYFSEVFKAREKSKRGFDIIIGNPPYGAKFTDAEKKDLRERYPETQFKIDSYSLFLLKSMKLMKTYGICYYIIPNTLLDNYFEEKVREKLLVKNTIIEIVDLHDSVFEAAVVHSMIFGFQNFQQEKYIIKIGGDNQLFGSLSFIPKSYFQSQEKFTFSFRNYRYQKLIDKLELNSTSLEKVLNVKDGIDTGNNKKYIKEKRENKNWKPVIGGKDIDRYVILSHKYILHGDHLANPRRPEVFEQEKLIVRETGDRIIATYDDNHHYALSTLYSMNLIDKNFSLKYLLGLLNSKVFHFLMTLIAFDKTKGAFTKTRIFHYYKLPIKSKGVNQKPFISIVDKILEAKKQNPEANTSSRERQLDIMVYHLYNLTYDEAKIIDATLNEEEWEKYKL